MLKADVVFKKEDILHPSVSTRHWGVIVSNPPYICQKEAEGMDANVLQHEPRLALFVPDNDPLLFYRAIAAYAIEHLSPSGCLYFEINEAYPNETSSLLEQMGFYDITVYSDNFGKSRFISAQKR